MLIQLKEWILYRGSINGIVYGHPRFKDGEQITTSMVDRRYIVTSSPIIVQTISGSVYELDPDSPYVDRLLALYGRYS